MNQDARARGVILAVFSLLALQSLRPPSIGAVIDAAGTWRLEGDTTAFRSVTQSAGSLSFTYRGVPVSGTINTTTGQFDVGDADGEIMAIKGEVLPGGRLVADVVVVFPSFSASS